MKEIDLPLQKLAKGAIQEKLDYELKKIFNNIHDPNTSPTVKRSVTIKLDFTPDKNRQTVIVDSNFSTKLANIEGVSTTVLTGRNYDTGKVEAKEMYSGAPGQTYFDDNADVRTDIGDPVEEFNKETKRNVVDLQRGSN